MPSEQGAEYSKIDSHAAQADEAKHQQPNRKKARGCLRNEEAQIFESNSAIEFALAMKADERKRQFLGHEAGLATTPKYPGEF